MIKMYIGLYVNNRYSRQIWIKLEFSRQSFEKYINIKFREIHSLWTEFHADGRADMTKLTVVSRNFAKAPKSECTE